MTGLLRPLASTPAGGLWSAMVDSREGSRSRRVATAGKVIHAR
jgi:hypothetical protein